MDEYNELAREFNVGDVKNYETKRELKRKIEQKERELQEQQRKLETQQEELQALVEEISLK